MYCKMDTTVHQSRLYFDICTYINDFTGKPITSLLESKYKSYTHSVPIVCIMLDVCLSRAWEYKRQVSTQKSVPRIEVRQ
jgi:hypothetical protein